MTDNSSHPDLNRVRDLFYQAQRSGVSYPDDPKDQVTVGKDAVIRVGMSPEKDSSLSKVQHGTFAATRIELERETARLKMPDNTQYLDHADGQGWLYSFETEFAERFELFAYFDGAGYQVLLVSPELEGKFNAHSSHLFPNGRLCLSGDVNSASGQKTLEEAYSKSVLWANGISVHRRGLPFPWSINNL